MKNLLITGATGFSNIQLEEFREIGFNVLFFQQENQELDFDTSTISAVICNNLFLHHNIDLFTQLQLVQLTSAGIDRFPLEKIKGRNIKLLNAAGVYGTPIAEWIVAKVLELYKHSVYFFGEQRNCNWQKHRGIRELAGQRASIVGFGNIGQETARKLKAFDVEIWAVENRELSKEELTLTDEVYSSNQLFEILPQVDIVILTLPLNDATFHMFDLNLMEQMKSSAILINTSRGGVIDEQALIQCLEEAKIGGAALDVFENEPLSKKSPLWKLDNVIVTPHNSFVSNRNKERLLSLCLKNLSI
jgi:phosphoglycerate dehydrogenase-like enzyme